jgi:predicted amidohydrolase
MLCVGIDEKDGDDLFDAAVLINRKGEILLKHRKINTLPELMDPPYAKGKVEDIKAVDTEYGRIGILICADTFLNNALENMRKCKPDLVLVPYGWAAKHEEWPEHGEKLRQTVVKAAAIGAYRQDYRRITTASSADASLLTGLVNGRIPSMFRFVK